MATVVADSSSTAEQIRHRKPRNPEIDPNPSRSKTTISSILSTSPTTDAVLKKKNNFSSATFRGLGCAASSQVSVPAVIRTSANWEAKKLKKKRLKTKKTGNDQLLIHGNSDAAVAAISASVTNLPSQPSSSLSLALSSSCVGAPDVWCGAGIGMRTDAASIDCVVSRRPSRGKVDVMDRINVLAPRERSYNVRRMVTPEDNPFLESDTCIGIASIHPDVSGSRHHHHHPRHGFREGLAEIVMLQSSLLMSRRSDRYRDLRLDTDNMSYEELLELSDRIGYVSTGLREDEITHCLGRTKLAVSTEMERKCSICQEEYEPEDETGKLDCGHSYHIYCIKQWLLQKNSCPICKTSVSSQTQAS